MSIFGYNYYIYTVKAVFHEAKFFDRTEIFFCLKAVFHEAKFFDRTEISIVQIQKIKEKFASGKPA